MIYILDNDPKLCAQYLDDKSLDKMIRDIAHVLCEAHIDQRDRVDNTYIDDVPLKLKFTKILFEWSQWARKCKANYLYLVEIGFSLLSEYHERIRFVTHEIKLSNPHKSIKVIAWARDNVPDLPEWIIDNSRINVYDPRPFPLVMPKKFIVYHGTIHDYEDKENIIESYRNYYQAKLRQKVYWCLPRTDQALRDHGIKWTNRSKPEWVKL